MEKNNKIRNLIIFALLVLVGLTGIILPLIFKESISKFLLYFFTILGSIAVFVGLFGIYKLYVKVKPLSVKQISLIGVMSALTVILYYFVKFNLPFFPPWLDIQVSEIPALITGFAYGPYAGSMVILVRFFIKLPTTITAGVGELADLILSLTLVIISSSIYKKHRKLKGAFVSMGIATLAALVVACIINWLVLIPAYIYIAGFKLEALVGMLNSYLPFEVTNANFMLVYIFVGALPFNLFRFILVFIFTFSLYKVTHRLLNKLSK